MAKKTMKRTPRKLGAKGPTTVQLSEAEILRYQLARSEEQRMQANLQLAMQNRQAIAADLNQKYAPKGYELGPIDIQTGRCAVVKIGTPQKAPKEPEPAADKAAEA